MIQRLVWIGFSIDVLASYVLNRSFTMNLVGMLAKMVLSNAMSRGGRGGEGGGYSLSCMAVVV